MPKTLRYRLFHTGAMPEALSAEIANDQVLFSVEGIPVTVRRHGTAPCFRGSSTGYFSGSFAVTDKRIVAGISDTIMLDGAYEGEESEGAEVVVGGDGLHVTIDAGIHPDCSGQIEMHFKQDLAEADRQGFPHLKGHFHFPAEMVPKIFGVPA